MSIAKSETAKLLTETVMTVFRLNGTILRAAERIARPAGLTPARWQVLGVVLAEPKTISEVARDLGLTRQSVQRVADELVAEGIAVYEENPAHARAKLFRPTEAGMAAIDRLADNQALWANAVSSSMTAAGLSDCLLALRALIAQMDEVESAMAVSSKTKVKPK